MKKILFILPCVPYPLTAGGNQAFFQYGGIYPAQNVCVFVAFSGK